MLKAEDFKSVSLIGEKCARQFKGAHFCSGFGEGGWGGVLYINLSTARPTFPPPPATAHSAPKLGAAWKPRSGYGDRPLVM